MLAIPVLAGSASTGLAGLLGKDWGFSHRVRQAPLFYALVVLGTVGGTALSLTGIDPMSLLVVVAVINGIAAAPFLVVVMLISADRSIMGDHTNRRWPPRSAGPPPPSWDCAPSPAHHHGDGLITPANNGRTHNSATGAGYLLLPVVVSEGRLRPHLHGRGCWPS